jgi:farnesyl diphosphate synthase
MPESNIADISLERAMADIAAAMEEQLDALLPISAGPEGRLHEAMRYAALNGGKRLRPFLAVESASLFNVSRSCALRVAAAIEMIHCYSLAHDDLPAMDDSPLRRGRPSTHIEYDEATAILAGDALLTRAFEVLSETATHGDPQVRVELIKEMASAAGPLGMCGGQMFDLMAEKDGSDFDLGSITRLQRLKTGEIIAFSCIAGAILGKAPQPARAALHHYAHDLGLAFQIADDLLDVEGDVEETGKEVRRDSDAGKATFVSILGVERARAQAALLADQAIAHLDMFEERADLLRQVARFVVARRK